MKYRIVYAGNCLHTKFIRKACAADSFLYAGCDVKIHLLPVILIVVPEERFFAVDVQMHDDVVVVRLADTHEVRIE
ncbi:MAG: hypothetical protein LBJ36_06355 [Synergistaceae bacterium]|jgi:hypothetical protein|nr:hypothetical protein [Synergistaceae bacterium]